MLTKINDYCVGRTFFSVIGGETGYLLGILGRLDGSDAFSLEKTGSTYTARTKMTNVKVQGNYGIVFETEQTGETAVKDGAFSTASAGYKYSTTDGENILSVTTAVCTASAAVEAPASIDGYTTVTSYSIAGINVPDISLGMVS